jgi:hypothetical protein
MLQFTLHLILTFCLLACPVRCSAHSVPAQADRSIQVVGCSCCGGCEAEPDDGEKSSDCPDDGCDCGNCICHGAVTQNDVDLASAADLDFWVFLSPIEVRLSNDTSLRVSPTHNQLTGNSYLSGRDARIAHQSWLI